MTFGGFLTPVAMYRLGETTFYPIGKWSGMVRAHRGAVPGRAGVPGVDPEVIGDIDSSKMGFPRDEPSLPA